MKSKARIKSDEEATAYTRGPTAQTAAKKGGSALVEYAEDIEDEFAAAETQNEMGAGAALIEAEPTEPEVPGDQDSVSSEMAPAAQELNIEPSDFGEVGPPATSETGLELEPVSGYDESMLELDRAQAQAPQGESKLLDAWYAEFADPLTRALVLQQPKLTETAAEVVIGADDRIQITSTTTYPWRAICSLRITAKDDSQWIGTGWLNGPGTVVTAGHVVYMHSRGGWVKRIEVVPGRNGAIRPYGSAIATTFRSVKGWTESKKRSHDYGAILLPAASKYGNQVGYFGFANLSLFSLVALKVNLSGYPGDKPVGTQWFHARRIMFVTPRTIVYNIDTAGGQSGSPVWRLKDGKRHCVGIHTNGSSLGNSATRIVDPVFDNLKKWKAEGA